MSEYTDYLKELFGQFGPIESRRMFGGHGIYYQGIMFGLVMDEVLYLKADAVLAPQFELRGLKPFQYQKGERLINLSFYMAPDELFDDPEEARIWATRAYEAALRSASLAKPRARARVGGKKKEPEASRTRRGSPRR